MSVIDERTMVADYDIVIINRGTRDGLEPGHVLEVWERARKSATSPNTPRAARSSCRTSATALAMIFKAYDRMSYGLMLAVGSRSARG